MRDWIPAPPPRRPMKTSTQLLSLAAIIVQGGSSFHDSRIPHPEFHHVSPQVLNGPKGSISLEERNRRKANRKRARARKMRRGW